MSTSRHRRQRVLALLLIAFVVVPVAEIWVIIQVGHIIGAWWTILLLLADAVFGSWLVRREGRRAWLALRTALQDGRLPSDELADGILLLIGGTLMLAPGFITDVFGAFLILPFTRPIARRVLAGIVNRRLTVSVVGTGPDLRADMKRPRPGHDDVVQGEVIQP